AMTHTKSRLGREFLNEIGQGIDRFDSVVDDVYLSAALQFVVDGIFDDGRLELGDNGLNRQTIAWRGFNHGHFAKSAQVHVQRSWDRSRRQCQNVDLFYDLVEAPLV